MGKKAKDRRAQQLAELKAQYDGRLDESIIEIIFQECNYDLENTKLQLDAVAEPRSPISQSGDQLEEPELDENEGNKNEKPSEEDGFDPVDADPTFAKLRREFPESLLDSAVLQLILDESRSKSIEHVRERLVQLTGHDPASAPRKANRKGLYSVFLASFIVLSITYLGNNMQFITLHRDIRLIFQSFLHMCRKSDKVYFLGPCGAPNLIFGIDGFI